MLDVGYDMIQLSVDHRVATHQGERQRLAAIDAVVAPVDLNSKCCSWSSSWKCLASGIALLEGLTGGLGQLPHWH